jgi:hypothetical protein
MGRSPLKLAVVVLAAAAALVAIPASAGAKTHAWLCRPGLDANPCDASLRATVVSASLKTKLESAKRAKRPPVDCFYVYPTTSGQSTTNANLKVDKELVNVALAQASRFSQTCRVYAPVYRQLTLAGIFKNLSTAEREQAEKIAYAGVLSAWRQYLKRWNKGRGVVLIGHSQGTGMLKQLIVNEIDKRRKARRRVVSALLLGGNVIVPEGRDVGGDFKHIPACRSRRQIGCVVAYSTFNEVPPDGTLFGRPRGVYGNAGGEVLCVNPAALYGSNRHLEPYFTVNESAGLLGGIGAFPQAKTAWVSFPNRYRARCRNEGGSSWLHADALGGAADKRPVLAYAPTPGWGLHLWDVNIALGNLVGLVKSESAVWLARR